MPAINEIHDATTSGLDLPGLPWLQKAIGPQLDAGRVYLTAGTPGVGKSTLILQLLGSLSSNGIKTLYLPTEQNPGDVKRSVERLFGPEPPQAIAENLFIDTVQDLSQLPWFLFTRIKPPDGEYHGCQVIAVDSLQGGGLSSQAGEKFRALLDFIKMTRSSGITAFMVGHVTKDGKIAGPKGLEHEVDCVLFMRRAFRFRSLVVPKHRDHATMLDPIMLSMTEHGLEYLHTVSRAATVLGYRGKGEELTEAQASVSIPKYGSRPAVTAPYLPAKKIELLLKTIGTLPGIEALEASYDISCGIPGGANQYSPVLDLAIVVAILSSYLHQPVMNKALFVGEVDLAGNVRPPGGEVLQGLAAAIVKSRPGEIKQVFVAQKAADELKEIRPEHGGARVGDVVDVRGVKDLEELVRELWPQVLGEERREPVDEFKPVACIPTSGVEDLVS